MKTSLLIVMSLSLLACKHQVEVDVKSVPPIEATVNVNLNAQRDLDSYFDYERATRYPQFHELKQQGKIGETFRGYVEAVEAKYAEEPEVKAMVESINRDRAMIYEAMAKERQLTAEALALQNAVRTFRAAEAGHWLRYSEGWLRKQ